MSSTRATFAALPPEVISRSVRVPILMSVSETSDCIAGECLGSLQLFSVRPSYELLRDIHRSPEEGIILANRALVQAEEGRTAMTLSHGPSIFVP